MEYNDLKSNISLYLIDYYKFCLATVWCHEIPDYSKMSSKRVNYQ